MNILKDKYISPDELKQIAYNTDPEDIIHLCSTNKILTHVCKEKNFWINYINGSQEKYNQFLIVLAESGNLLLFNKLWNNPPGVINEHKILAPSCLSPR